MSSEKDTQPLIKALRKPVDKQLKAMLRKAATISIEGWDHKRGGAFMHPGMFVRVGKEKLLSITITKGKLVAIDSVIEMAMPRNTYLRETSRGLRMLGFKSRKSSMKQIQAARMAEKLPLEKRLKHAPYALRGKGVDYYFFDGYRTLKAHLVIHLKVPTPIGIKFGKAADTATTAKEKITKAYRVFLSKPD